MTVNFGLFFFRLSFRVRCGLACEGEADHYGKSILNYYVQQECGPQVCFE